MCIDNEIIITSKDVLRMLDNLLEQREADWWNKFYTNKEKPVPFFGLEPDENLVSYFKKGIIKAGKALELGCGNGRNAIFLAKNNFIVDAVDFSKISIDWALENTKDLGVNYICESVFNLELKKESYDFIYDSGLLHHIKPHKREEYFNIILNALKPGGYYGVTCFNLLGGANISDYDVYKDNSMHGGLGFSEYKLKRILETYFTIIEFREMNESNEGMFGKNFLWTVLLKK